MKMENTNGDRYRKTLAATLTDEFAAFSVTTIPFWELRRPEHRDRRQHMKLIFLSLTHSAFRWVQVGAVLFVVLDTFIAIVGTSSTRVSQRQGTGEGREEPSHLRWDQLSSLG